MCPIPRLRHKKENPRARCCWVCGKLGGYGFSRALRAAGYIMEPGEMGYAHHTCMARAMRAANAMAPKKFNGRSRRLGLV